MQTNINFQGRHKFITYRKKFSPSKNLIENIIIIIIIIIIMIKSNSTFPENQTRTS